MSHPLNWVFGWSMVLLAFAGGAAIGMRFHREDFLGGYASLRRRLLRLAHVACAALGMLNILFALSPLPGHPLTTIASALWIAGAILMPAVCTLSAWHDRLRALFFLPVLTLACAVVLTLLGGLL